VSLQDGRRDAAVVRVTREWWWKPWRRYEIALNDVVLTGRGRLRIRDKIVTIQSIDIRRGTLHTAAASISAGRVSVKA
jgi:hypothetical protein